ncbi:hypothetical protein [Streptomyces sp. NPDC097640]|uniref:hypothetical protein n=1 Tax=Streptomyces sp. NPDC097640 TaxID=3157229 RepID=UPI003328B399
MNDIAAVHEGRTGTIRRINVTDDGAQSAGEADYPAADASGRTVVFISAAGDLAPGDANG